MTADRDGCRSAIAWKLDISRIRLAGMREKLSSWMFDRVSLGEGFGIGVGSSWICLQPHRLHRLPPVLLAHIRPNPDRLGDLPVCCGPHAPRRTVHFPPRRPLGEEINSNAVRSCASPFISAPHHGHSPQSTGGRWRGGKPPATGHPPSGGRRTQRKDGDHDAGLGLDDRRALPDAAARIALRGLVRRRAERAHAAALGYAIA